MWYTRKKIKEELLIWFTIYKNVTYYYNKIISVAFVLYLFLDDK